MEASMMEPGVMMAEMAWTTYQRRIRAGQPVLLPCGALEQHGPHMAMGVDFLIPTAICGAVARRIGAVVAPPILFGYKSQPKMGGGNHFCGTTSLDGGTLCSLVRDVLRELVRHGARRIALVNGHYENQMFTIEGIDLALRDLDVEAVRDLRIVRLEYWDFTTEETLKAVFPDGFPGFALEHAAVMETSLMLHLHPGLVDMTALPDDGPAVFPPYDIHPVRPGWVPCSGALSRPHTASAEKGAILFDNYVDGVAAALRDEFTLG